MSSFVLDNSLQMTKQAMHQVLAVFSCNLLHSYEFYCHFQVFSTCGMFICHFVFQYCSQILNWIEIWAVTRPIKLINLKVSYISQFSCKNLIFGMSSFVLDNSLQMTKQAMHQVLAVQYSAVIFCIHMSFIAISKSSALVGCSSATLSFNIAYKF